MTLEVLKGSTYIIFIAKDEGENVVAVLPVKAKDILSQNFKDELKDFFRMLGEMPKRINFSAKVLFVADIIRQSIEQLKKEIEEEEKKSQEILSKKLERMRKIKGAKILIRTTKGR